MQEIRTACVILNTAEYCQTTSLQLEERLKDKVDEEYKDKITFQDERETFTRCVRRPWWGDRSNPLASFRRALQAYCGSWNRRANRRSRPSCARHGLIWRTYLGARRTLSI